MSASTLNPAVGSVSFVEVLVKFFKSFAVNGKGSSQVESAWAEGARFM